MQPLRATARRSMPPSARAGFTLVELLVVIAIIGVLIDLLNESLRQPEVTLERVEDSGVPELREVGSRAATVLGELEQIYREQVELLEPLTRRQGTLPVEELRGNLLRLVRAQTQLESSLLPALEALIPELRGRDQVLATRLYGELEEIALGNQRDILLKRFLLVGKAERRRP